MAKEEDLFLLVLLTCNEKSKRTDDNWLEEKTGED